MGKIRNPARKIRDEVIRAASLSCIASIFMDTSNCKIPCTIVAGAVRLVEWKAAQRARKMEKEFGNGAENVHAI